MTTSSKATLDKHFEGRAVTDGWDVLVSYAEGPLNLLLQDRWAKKLKTTGIPIPISYDLDMFDPPLHVELHYTVQLSAPSLSFDTSAGKAKLVIDIDGSVYGVQNGVKNKKVTQLQHGYQLEVDVPIAYVTGDSTEHTLADNPINFKDDTEAAYYLVFHFQNEDTHWGIRSPDLKTHPVDQNMRKMVDALMSWLRDQNNVQWIDLRMGEVTNKSNPQADTDTLRPRSFVFTTREGVLNVFIYTTGSAGAKSPLDNRDYPNDSTLPIATGYGASVIISHRLFGKYVLDHIKDRCKDKLSTTKTSIVGRNVNDIVEKQQPGTPAAGIEWSLYLAGGKTWNLSNPVGMDKYTINSISEDFDTHPLIFGVKNVQGSDGYIPRSTWSWYMQATADWTLADITNSPAGTIITNYCGRTKVTATLDKTGKPFGKLEGDEIVLEVDHDTSQAPTVACEALDRPDGPYRSSMVIPPAIQSLQITLPSFKAQVKGLDFFMAKNVIIPGTTTNPIRATDVIVPHDVFVLAKMPTSTNTSYWSLGPAGEAVPPESAPGSGPSMEDLLDRLYTNDTYLATFVHAAINGDRDEISALLAKEAPGLDATSLNNFLDEHTSTGPDFDIRYAGGVYKPQDSSSPFHELMVHPVHRTIYVDGHAVRSQVKYSDGHITFVTHDGKMNYKVNFTIKDILNPKGGSFSFDGKAWPTAESENSATPVAGVRTFPWDQEPSSASIHVDRRGYKSLALALDLVNLVDEEEPPATEEQLAEDAPADPLTVIGAITSVLNMLNGFLNLDKNTGESLRRLKKRFGRVKRAILGKDREGFAKELKGFADVSDAEKELAIEAARIVNQSLNKSKSTDPTAVLEEVKPEINKALADFLYSGIEIASRQGFRSGFLLDGDGLEEAFKAAIEKNLEKFVSRDHYDAYLDALVNRVMSERERDDMARESRDITKQILETMQELKKLRDARNTFERERATHEHALEEKGKSPEEAKKEVQAEIDRMVHEEAARNERLEGERKTRDVADKKRSELKEDIEQRKEAEAEQKAHLWREHGK